ncbi:hypothetical protein J3459_006239 [Metarhizium acridum]|nr:hypothetical protein J3459_006239 [Metarhizium acridum]
MNVCMYVCMCIRHIAHAYSPNMGIAPAGRHLTPQRQETSMHVGKKECKVLPSLSKKKKKKKKADCITSHVLQSVVFHFQIKAQPSRFEARTVLNFHQMLLHFAKKQLTPRRFPFLYFPSVYTA